MRKVSFLVVLLILIFGVVFVYWNYYNVYSKGNRDGRLLKFSKKGNVFKTYEGQLQYGTGTMSNAGFNPSYFYFSVSDEAVADSLNKCSGKMVVLHYLQYRRSLPWRGDNYNGKNQEKGQYIIDQVVSVSE